MKIQILGAGCPKCRKLAANAEEAARGLGVGFEIEKITDVAEILGFGVMRTPALAVDGRVVVSGKVPGADEIKKLIS